MVHWFFDCIDRAAPWLLAAVAALVGVAIGLDGQAAKSVNGAAGIAWLVIAGTLLWRDRRHGWRGILFPAVVALFLVLVAKPSDLAWAAGGFVVGGALVAWFIKATTIRQAMLLPALWLPIHLGVAGTRAFERAVRDLPAHVRSDPPPTAAAVPLVMVLASYLGAYAVMAIRERRRSEAVVPALK